MQTVLIVVHLMIVLSLAAVVLIQRSEGGGLGLGGGGSGGGVSGFLTGRGQANVLTRTTAILGAAFFVTSLALSIIASRARDPGSILDRVPSSSGPVVPGPASAPGAPTAPPVGGTVLDALQSREGAAPPAPANPGPPQVPRSQ